jgi:hypothetical protein
MPCSQEAQCQWAQTLADFCAQGIVVLPLPVQSCTTHLGSWHQQLARHEWHRVLQRMSTICGWVHKYTVSRGASFSCDVHPIIKMGVPLFDQIPQSYQCTGACQLIVGR